MTDYTYAARNAALRQRRKDAGLVLIRVTGHLNVYVTREQAEAIAVAVERVLAPQDNPG